jgi:hypothetical protein
MLVLVRTWAMLGRLGPVRLCKTSYDRLGQVGPV